MRPTRALTREACPDHEREGPGDPDRPPAGGSWRRSESGPLIETDAVESCRVLSGRGHADGLLTTHVPFFHLSLGGTMHTYRARPDISVLADYLEVPGLGFLPVNAFVIHAARPVVVDTGLGLPDRDFLASLAEVIDPADVAWIWLTHPDRDHTGGLFALLDAAPRARVVTTFAGAGIMSTEHPLPMNRIYLLNPGQSLDAGDRGLTGFRPPLFDNPATVGILDTRTGTCLSSDCFGAPLPTPALATAEDAAAASPEELRAAQLLWATVDSPWVHTVDPAEYATSFAPLRGFGPSAILSTHLPPFTSDSATLFDTLLGAPRPARSPARTRPRSKPCCANSSPRSTTWPKGGQATSISFSGQPPKFHDFRRGSDSDERP
jgi:metallo-beta-lactamase superfamily protein